MQKTILLFFWIFISVSGMSFSAVVLAQTPGQQRVPALTYFQEKEILKSSNPSISIELKEVTLADALVEIAKKARAGIYFDAELLPRETVSFTFHDTPLSEILENVLKETRLEVNTLGRNIFLEKREPAEVTAKENINNVKTTQETVSGRVTDAQTGEALPGVNVIVVGSEELTGSTIGAVTDMDGTYELVVPEDLNILSFTYIGYQRVEIPIDGRSEIIIQLEQDVQLLEDLVVVAYGQQDRVTVTGALATIRSRELLQSPQANISNTLVGRMPGLLAVQRSGQPGADQSELRIRGFGTFSGSQDPLVMVDGIETENFNNIDPNEIDNITILKDASSTAVYGVRGANGVILITTKRGTQGKPQVSFTSNYAFTQFTNLRESSQAYDYVTSYNKARAYDSFVTGSYNPRFTEQEINQYIPENYSSANSVLYPDMDWVDVMYKPTTAQSQYNLNITGGVERVSYFVSVGYFNQEGLFSDNITRALDIYDAQPRFQRYNFRSNLDFDVTNYFRININVSSQIEQRTGNTANLDRTIEIITKSSPINTPGIVDGRLIASEITGPGGQNGPDQLLRSNYQRHYRNFLNSSIQLSYDLSAFIVGLGVHGTVSYQTYNTQDQNFGNTMVRYWPRELNDGTLLYIPVDNESPISFNEEVEKNRREYVELGFNYERTFYEGHKIGGLVLYNQSKLHDPDLAFLIPRGYQGLVGRITYSYRNRYLTEFNLGYNGTENFAEGNRFGFFPAYSLGWVLSEEPFFPDNKLLTFFKIRGSYGEVGNDQIGGARFLYQPTAYLYHNNWVYTFGDIGNRNEYSGTVEDIPGNSNLTWERARKINLGIEASFWEDNLSVNVDLFEETRDNILAQFGTVPTIIGAPVSPYNFGEMKNRGFEADIKMNQWFRNVNFWIRANYTLARNTIQFQDEVNREFPYQFRTGQRYGQMFGLIADGIYNTWEEVNAPNRPRSAFNNDRLQPGDIKYRDVNGDGIIDQNDEVPIGYPRFPEKIFGFSFGGSYKGFDLSVLFQGASNVSVNYSRHARYGFREDAGVAQYLVDYSWTEERYQHELPIKYPRLGEGDIVASHNYRSSTFWIKDASYLRVKNVEFGYTLSSGILNSWGLRRARIFMNGNNLFTWSKMIPGIDPETHIASTNSEPYPATRTVNFGLNIEF